MTPDEALDIALDMIGARLGVTLESSAGRWLLFFVAIVLVARAYPSSRTPQRMAEALRGTLDRRSRAFGGFRQSGYGKGKAHHAPERFCEYKNTWIELSG